MDLTISEASRETACGELLDQIEAPKAARGSAAELDCLLGRWTDMARSPPEALLSQPVIPTLSLDPASLPTFQQLKGPPGPSSITSAWIHPFWLVQLRQLLNIFEPRLCV